MPGVSLRAALLSVEEKKKKEKHETGTPKVGAHGLHGEEGKPLTSSHKETRK